MAAHDQGKFWAFHDALYRKRAKFDEQDLYAIAKDLRLDMPRFKRAMNGTDLDARISRDQQLAMALGVRGTPAYFVNGRPIEGARPELHFRLLVEEELQRAAAALAEGVKPEQLYETLIQRAIE